MYQPNWDSHRFAGAPGTSQKAADVLSYGIDSIKSFYDLFENSRKDRGAKRGGYTTNAEQDLLRSMIVFAAATLDSVIKQVIRDCLHAVTAKNIEAHKEFAKFVDRRLRVTEGEASVNIPLLRAALLSGKPDVYLTEEYISDLTGSSLQSTEEVDKSANALGLDLGLGKDDRRRLGEVFGARNEIIHELDYLHRKRKEQLRNRRNRNREVCLTQVEALLRLANKFVANVSAA